MKTKLFSVSIKDCRVDTFTCGGKGGSGKDTNNSGVRITHDPSGAVGECREERHQYINKQRAFTRMAQSKAFQSWVRLVAAEIRLGKTLDERVDEDMDSKHLKVEIRDSSGKWVEDHEHVR